MREAIKWILIICIGPEVLALALRIAASGAVWMAVWLDKWPLNPF